MRCRKPANQDVTKQRRRSNKTVYGTPTVTTTYVYSGPHVIAEYEDSGSGVGLVRKYIYGPGIDEPIAMVSVDAGQESWYFYHTDGLGSVTALSQWNTAASQAIIVERYRYDDVFGRTTVCDGNGSPRTVNASAVGNPIMFTGRRLDVESALYDYRARIVSPALGRFLQTDPLGYADGMNLYQYCGNNPVNRIDPLGLSWGNVFDMFLQWLFEAGPGHRTFREGSEEVEELRNATGVNEAREKFHKENQERTEKGKPPKEIEHRYEFGIPGLIDSGANPTRQFCGGYRVIITPNGDGTKTITVTNDTNMRSFLYHAPGTTNYPRNKGGIGGSMTQEYTWREDIGYRGQEDNYLGILRNRVPRNQQIEKLIKDI